jgi:hypothetical protein
MNTACGLLQLLSVACLGVFAGTMLTEGFVLVPYWQSLAPADFFAWYAANDERLLGFFSPVTSVTALVALATAAVSLKTGHPARWANVVACASILAAVAMFFAYFESANASFSAASVAAADLPAELSRWAAWHDVRIVLSLVALGCSMLALRRAA